MYNIGWFCKKNTYNSNIYEPYLYNNEIKCIICTIIDTCLIVDMEIQQNEEQYKIIFIIYTYLLGFYNINLYEWSKTEFGKYFKEGLLKDTAHYKYYKINNILICDLFYSHYNFPKTESNVGTEESKVGTEESKIVDKYTNYDPIWYNYIKEYHAHEDNNSNQSDNSNGNG